MGIDYRVGSGPGLGALVFRLTDANNFLLLETFANTLYLFECRTAGCGMVASQPLPGPLVPDSTHRLEVRAMREHHRRLVGWRAAAAGRQHIPADGDSPRSRLEFGVRRDIRLCQFRAQRARLGARVAVDWHPAPEPGDCVRADGRIECRGDRHGATDLPVVRGCEWDDGRADCGRDVEQLHDAGADEHDQLLGTREQRRRHGRLRAPRRSPSASRRPSRRSRKARRSTPARRRPSPWWPPARRRSRTSGTQVRAARRRRRLSRRPRTASPHPR